MMAQSAYAQRMARLSARIFGEVPPNRLVKKSGLEPKVVRIFAEKPLDKRPEIVEYYPRHIELSGILERLRYLGLFRDEHADFKDEMVRLRALRGKVKTKKGEGKRAAKR
ncbi:small ribosomal subunit protein mS33-like isoform X2 [Watersipora subatra]